MTQLRDARLKRALQSAEDEVQGPARATREAVRAAARRAVRPPWWRRVWDAPAQWTPLHAAFASVMVATLVTLMWQGRDLPQPPTQGPLPVEPAAAPAPATPVSSHQARAPAPVPQGAPGAAAPALAAREPSAASRLPEHSSVKAAAPFQAAAPKAADTAPAVLPMPAPAPAERAAPPPAADPEAKADSQGRRPSAEAVADAARAAAPAAASATSALAPPPMSAPAPVARRAPASPAASTQGWLQPASLPQWNELQLSAQGRSLTLRRGESASVDALVDEMIAPAPLADAGPVEPVLRLEVRASQRLLGTLELGEAGARWMPVQGPPVGVAASAQRQRLLRDELLARLR